MIPYADVFEALNRVGVRYVVVGGVAVVLRGHARLTVDLDLVVDLEKQQAGIAVETLLALGFTPRLPVDARQFADETVRGEWVANKNLEVFSLFDPANPLREVDLFARYPMSFDELHEDASDISIDGIPVRVASVDHLIAMKRAVGRPQDLDDINALTNGK